MHRHCATSRHPPNVPLFAALVRPLLQRRVRQHFARLGQASRADVRNVRLHLLHPVFVYFHAQGPAWVLNGHPKDKWKPGFLISYSYNSDINFLQGVIYGYITIAPQRAQLRV